MKMNETIVIFDGVERRGSRVRGRRRVGGVGVGRPEGGPVAPEGLGRVSRRALSAGAVAAAVQAVLGRWKRAAPARAHVCPHVSSSAPSNAVLY